jgi:RHS repeat-associated protein
MTSAARNFATYERSASTGVDYADQRYYSGIQGRFLSPDLISASNAAVLPGNWNKFTYVDGDPVNKNDPRGLCSPQDSPPCYSSVTEEMTAETRRAYELWYDFLQTSAQNPTAQPGPTAQERSILEEPRRAHELLNPAISKALEALKDPDCRNLFGNMSDPVTGNALDPETILKSFQVDANWGTRAYGSISFESSSGETAANITGDGLRFGSSGAYYNRVNITINTTYWNMGYTSQNTTTLLHELGHTMNFLSAGVGSRNAFYQYDAYLSR